jgi:RNA polymerase sigma-70 factor (ECF subfamily)
VKLVQEHRFLLYKVCRLYCFTEADRQDLFQEIVIQLWKSYPGFRGDSKFSTWLYRIALNTAISDLRKQGRRPSTTSTSEILPSLPDMTWPGEEEQQLQQLYAAIARLSDVEKALVMLYLEDKPYEEMEEIMGINQNNLRVKMNRIREKLRKMTKEAAYGIR